MTLWLTLRRMVLMASVGITLAAGQTRAPSHAASLTSGSSPLHSLAALLDGTGFAPIPAGEFLMGSRTGSDDEQPQHRVSISRGFEMGKVEVTQAQWDAVMGKAHGAPNTRKGADSVNPSKFKGSTRPVENVSWEDVQHFLERLNTRDPAHLYRLPTEAEWEYACRAGQAGDDTGPLDSLAWYDSNSKGETKPVAEKQPNAWNLYDMHGNVREWVQDWYSPEYYAGSSRRDPQGPSTSSYKIYRGCAWLSEAKYCRAAYRGFNFPNTADYSVGFRLVRVSK